MISVNSRVVCINDTPPPYKDITEFHREFPDWIVKNRKYTIRDIFYNDGIVTSVVLKELKNPILFFPGTINRSQEASFKITRFRELEEDEIGKESNSRSQAIQEAEKMFDGLI